MFYVIYFIIHTLTKEHSNHTFISFYVSSDHLWVCMKSLCLDSHMHININVFAHLCFKPSTLILILSLKQYLNMAETQEGTPSRCSHLKSVRQDVDQKPLKQVDWGGI